VPDDWTPAHGIQGGIFETSTNHRVVDRRDLYGDSHLTVPSSALKQRSVSRRIRDSAILARVRIAENQSRDGFATCLRSSGSGMATKDRRNAMAIPLPVKCRCAGQRRNPPLPSAESRTRRWLEKPSHPFASSPRSARGKSVLQEAPHSQWHKRMPVSNIGHFEFSPSFRSAGFIRPAKREDSGMTME
jgi:hypothetical protein